MHPLAFDFCVLHAMQNISDKFVRHIHKGVFIKNGNFTQCFPRNTCLIRNRTHDILCADFAFFAGIDEQAYHFFAFAAVKLRAAQIDIIQCINIICIDIRKMILQ